MNLTDVGFGQAHKTATEYSYRQDQNRKSLMLWSDLVIAAGQTCFFVAQVGMIRRHARVPLFSACLTAFWLWAFVPAFVSRGWWASAVSCAAGAVNWTILAWRNREVAR